VIRVLLVDDHSSFRQPLAFMMQREPDLEVVAQAGSLAEGRRVLKDAKDVGVAVVDLDLPDGNGADLVRDLRTANPRGMVMVLTASKDQAQIARAVEAGASGVMHKSASISEIIDAVRRLSEGQQLLSTIEVIEMLRLIGEQRERNRDAQAALGRLTKREREVLQALADGLNDKEIADRLRISTETARTHMVNILGKLGVDSRLQALVFAVRHGAVKID
jgi:two-component system nitrate/nitrite response regulator NarL